MQCKTGPRVDAPRRVSNSMRNTGSASEENRAPLLSQIAIVVPTFNASRYWRPLQDALQQQGIVADQVLIVDSSSTDDTRLLAEQAGYQLKTIARENFRHGATRQFAAELLPWAEVLVYLTQDALPHGAHSFQSLLRPFALAKVGACYGRQLPRAEANSIERHARLFNYPNESAVRTFESRKQLGIRAAFFSNPATPLSRRK